MGGVFHSAEGNPHVWQVVFPPEVQDKLVSADNQDGTIMNSDIEHTGILAQVSTIAVRHPVRCVTIATFVDNTPAESQVHKKAVAGNGAPAKQCIFATEHQCEHRHCHVAQCIPGEANVMADDASHLQCLTDSEFYDPRYP